MGYTIGLFNDSFPPVIDGVANTVINYAKIINRDYGESVVVTPAYPKVIDDYPFKVLRYFSVPLTDKVSYRAGLPFSRRILRNVLDVDMDLIHVHSPFASGILARRIARKRKIPIVATYHTKFDLDFEQYIKPKRMRQFAINRILSFFNSVDEVWVVNAGTGKALENIGFKGTYRVMVNGTDFIRGKAPEEDIAVVKEKHSIADDELVFIFVGRMIWHKNTRIIIEALKTVRDAGIKFKMLFVGDGYDKDDMKALVKKLGLDDVVAFPGVIKDRKLLRAYFSCANMFLFPSIYDNAPIVVREAAACLCPSLLVAGSCSAEGINDNENGFLTSADSTSFAKRMLEIIADPALLKQVGENASKTVFLSWDEAVGHAAKRYQEIIDAWPYPLPCKKVK